MNTNPKSRRFPVWLLCVWAFIAGGAGPLFLGHQMQAQLGRSTEALGNLSAACDRRDAAYRTKSDAQDKLIAEMRKGIDVRDRVISAQNARGHAEGGR